MVIDFQGTCRLTPAIIIHTGTVCRIQNDGKRGSDGFIRDNVHLRKQGLLAAGIPAQRIHLLLRICFLYPLLQSKLCTKGIRIGRHMAVNRNDIILFDKLK